MTQYLGSGVNSSHKFPPTRIYLQYSLWANGMKQFTISPLLGRISCRSICFLTRHWDRTLLWACPCDQIIGFTEKFMYRRRCWDHVEIYNCASLSYPILAFLQLCASLRSDHCLWLGVVSGLLCVIFCKLFLVSSIPLILSGHKTIQICWLVIAGEVNALTTQL